MKIKYETNIATLVQFITISLLGIANGLNSIVTTCVHSSDDCVTNSMLSIIFFIITALFFAGVWVLGYTVQDRRSTRLAQLLILVELGIISVAFLNARHHTDLLSLFTSIIDMLLALWVIYACILLIKNGGKRAPARRPAKRRRRR